MDSIAIGNSQAQGLERIDLNDLGSQVSYRQESGPASRVRVYRVEGGRWCKTQTDPPCPQRLPPQLLDLPPEVLSDILLLLSPTDVSRYSRACHATYDFCHPNSHLWSSLFHILFDPLPRSQLDGRKPYEAIVQERIQATHVAFRESPEVVDDLMRSAITSILSISSQSTSPTSLNTKFLQQYLPGIVDFCLDEETASTSSLADQRLLAHYLSLHGAHTPEDRLRSLMTVYSAKNYTSRTKFGPFLSDSTGRIDWSKIRAIRHVMEGNIELAVSRGQWSMENDFEIPLGGTWGAVARREGVERDWAGVEGKWIGSYVYLSWDIFDALNTGHSPDLDEFSEAIGEPMVLSMKLLPATPTAQAPSDPRYPTLSFAGTLRGLTVSPTSPSLQLRGSVQYRNGETTWKYIILYGGVVQWALEGAQCGEPGSRMGCFGIWTHAAAREGEREVGGPCGPFWWWPVEG